MSSHHHLILFHLNVLNQHISSLHFFSAHSSSVTSLFFPSICSLPPTCFRATLSSSCLVLGLLVFFSPSSCCVSFPFNDDLGTPPTRRPHSWKKGNKSNHGNLEDFKRKEGPKRKKPIDDRESSRLTTFVHVCRVR